MLIELAERRALPDAVIRQGIRRLLGRRLDDAQRAAANDPAARRANIRALFADGSIAEATDAANRQHYEAPTELFQLMLGPRLKYSGCLWEDGVDQLDEAEETMLRLTCRRADVRDGHRILDLGCGWGSMALWLAETHPQSQILAVSNSRSQHDYIVDQARRRGLANLSHAVVNVGDLDSPADAVRQLLPDHDGESSSEQAPVRFDRVVSVEMFEHMRNIDKLLDCLASVMQPQGKLLIHMFCHRRWFYPFV
ncbi:MAG: class I SAM-dependent methyltransferase, partial [Planctomycetota bacterium]